MRTLVSILALAAAASAFAAPEAPVFTQAGAEAYTFDTGVLQGGLRAEGKSIGSGPGQQVVQ